MPLRITIGTAMLIAAVTVLVTIGSAGAQLDNKPFSFKNSPTGGPGISQAGKQAIINEKLFNSTPENLQIGPDGRLVDVIEGPGKSAIVFEHGTNSSIPGFKGTDFRGDNPLMSVGVFNAYFGPVHNSTSLSGHSYAQFHTAALISSWTTNVVSGAGLPPYYGNNPVDSWTVFTNSLNKF